MLPPALFGLTAYQQFIVYKLVPRAGLKYDKLPCDWRSGAVCSAHDLAVWTDADTAAATAASWGPEWGVGFVFTERDPFWFLDIDSCLVPPCPICDKGLTHVGSQCPGTQPHWSALAMSLCGLLAGCAVEVSQSGTGLHIFGCGVVPPHGCRNQAMGLEFYTAGRFVALTGVGAVGSVMTDATAVLPALVTQYFPADVAAGGVEGWTDGPCEGWNGPRDDAELIRRAMQSRSTASAFGNRASFSDLWLADERRLGSSYPDSAGRPYDASAADSALAQHLAFWTGCDCERIRRLMQGSKLVRDKWEREDYLPRTILGAVARQSDVLVDKPREVVAPLVGGPTEGPRLRGGNGFLGMEEMLEHFKGCVYIEIMNRALVPDGSILKPDAFSVRYGGFSFRMDANNEKVVDDAWKAWTQNKVHSCVSAYSTCFKPELPLGSIVTVNGQRFVNTFIPLDIERRSGDFSPFLTHLDKLLPDKRDASIFLSYMAACVQHQGTKFQWAPLLQGVQGNGKSFFSYCVEGAVGARYTHWPKAKKLAKDFNVWMTGKVFYAVEDIYVPDSKREVMEDLKPMITGRSMEIEAKGVDQVTADICGNFIFNSNHKDGIAKTDTDRRFCMLFTAQQSVEDLDRENMRGNYLPDLYKWLRNGGQAIVNEFLYTYKIPDEFNPARDCQRAPSTSSSDEAIHASKGNVEQEIEEAIEQGLQGFCGGWISSLMFDRHLDNLGMSNKISRGKRRQILDQMGYVQHPNLSGGRVNNMVIPDSGKPRLYIHKSNKTLSKISNPVDIAKAYEQSNKNLIAHPFTR